MTRSLAQPQSPASGMQDDSGPSSQAQPKPAESVASDTSTTTSAKRAKPGRDHRLDFWRGLCLIDMLLVHFIHQGMSLGHAADSWIGDYTRFAAGGFVFVAGLSIGRIFLPKAIDPAKRWSTYQSLWKRSLVILLVHYLAEIGFLVMWPLFGDLSFRRIETPIWHIITFRSGYDLLPFYVVMVALAPAMLELLRRRLGWLLGVISLGVFCAAHATGFWQTFKLPIHHDFFPILWQIIFVAGMIGGDLLPKYDRLSNHTKVTLACSMWASQVFLFLAYYGKDFGVDWHVQWLFAKVPLTGGEALRYLTLILAIIFTTDLIWNGRLSETGLARVAERLGRNSLPVYVFHVWVVQVAVQSSAFVHPVFLRVGLASLGLVSLWVFAWLLESARPGTRARAKGIEPPPATNWAQVIWAFLGKKVGGLSVLAAATFSAVLITNSIHGRLTHRFFRPNQVIRSPDADLFIPKDEVPLPTYEPDPKDPSPDDDEDPEAKDEPVSLQLRLRDVDRRFQSAKIATPYARQVRDISEPATPHGLRADLRHVHWA